MWIFGQVWFACLVGFAVGVLLDWVIRVRPLTRRVTELEARLADEARAARQDGEYGRSVFDRGPFASAGMTSDGFVANRNRGGLLAPSAGLGTELLDQHGQAERGPTGVEDFPGVARLSEQWEEAEEATRAAPEPWQPVPTGQQPAEEPWESEAPTEPDPAGGWQPAESADAPTQVTWLSERPTPTESTAPVDPVDADAQYLEFLRAGANHAPIGPSVDDEDDEDIAHGELTGATSGDPTSVLPQIEGYEAYESYADEYEQNGHRANGYAEGTTESYDDYADFQPDEFDEPAESASPLPRRGAHSESLRFAPFEIPFDATPDAELVDVQPRSGELTPIEEGGFQPFQKPADVETVGYDDTWMGDDRQLVDTPYDAASANGTRARTDVDPGSSSWFDLSETNAQVGAESGMTQRMLPVSRPDLDHPDLLPESVFGTETDRQYADEGPARSLFEPVIEPDELEDSFQAPAYERPAYEPQSYESQSYESQSYEPQTYEPPAYESQTYGDQSFGSYEPSGYDEGPVERTDTVDDAAALPERDEPAMTETTTQFQAPPPIRVRTGVDGPATQVIPSLPVEPEAGAEQQAEPGPFGPGSALPQPDGSPPDPGFSVKARTSSMVFHTESSPFYDRLEPQVWFRTPEDAQRAGFTSWERPRNW